MSRAFFKTFYYLAQTLFLISTYSASAHAQTIDSIRMNILLENDPIKKGDLYTSLALKLIRIDVDEAEKYIDTAGMIPEYFKDYESNNWMLFMRARIAQRRQNLDTALVILHQLAANHEIDTLEKLTIGNVYYTIGDISRRQSDNETAVLYMDKAKAIYEAADDPSSYANCDIILGIIYKNLKQYDKAIQYYSDAYATYERLERYDPMATCILNIATVLKNQGKYKESLEKFVEAEKIAERLSDVDNLKSYIYGNRASLYEQMNQPKKAYSEMLASYELRKKNASPRELANSLTGLSIASIKLGNLSVARDYLEKLKNIIDNNDGMLSFKSKYHEAISQYYEKTGQLQLAIDNKNQYIILKDSLRQIDLDKKVLELNEELETEKKEREIVELNSENQLAEVKLKSTQRQVTLGSIGLVIISLLSAGLFYLFRQSQSKNAIITKGLQEKELLLKEIHHRVKNNLQFISALLGLQTEHVSDEVALEVLQEGQDRVQSMALIHQDLYQRDDLTSVNMKEYFVKLIEGLFDSYNIRPESISLQLNIDELNLDVDSVIPIGLIVNELVSNSLKYAFKDANSGKIEVTLAENNGLLRLQVNDNGKGITDQIKETLGQSLGYKLIHALTEQLEGTFDIDGSNGTHVNITIKKYQKSLIAA